MTPALTPRAVNLLPVGRFSERARQGRQYHLPALAALAAGASAGAVFSGKIQSQKARRLASAAFFTADILLVM